MPRRRGLALAVDIHRIAAPRLSELSAKATRGTICPAQCGRLRRTAVASREGTPGRAHRWTAAGGNRVELRHAASEHPATSGSAKVSGRSHSPVWPRATMRSRSSPRRRCSPSSSSGSSTAGGGARIGSRPPGGVASADGEGPRDVPAGTCRLVLRGLCGAEASPTPLTCRPRRRHQQPVASANSWSRSSRRPAGRCGSHAGALTAPPSCRSS
jgi:hypothetical protein